MEPSLILVGLNHRSAPVEVREKFWFSEDRAYKAMENLVCAPGIEEVAVISTCNRTEFVLWASHPGRGTESLQAYLREHFELSPEDWTNFYRYAGEAAVTHLFRVTSGLDSMVVGEPEITGQVKGAWNRAQRAGASGRMLDTVFHKALNVCKRTRTETAIGNLAVSVPYAAVELAKQIFGSLGGRSVLVLGAGKMSELSARYLAASGAREIHVTNRTLANAQLLANELGGQAIPYEERWNCLAHDDIVISSTGCPHFVFTREDAERVRAVRKGRPIFLIDIAVPRDIDPAVRDLPGMFLYDIDDLERVVARNLAERKAAASEADLLIQREARAFHARLDAERVVPTIIALRAMLDEIRQEEIENSRGSFGELNESQEKAILEMTARITQRVANRLARELKQVEQSPERDQLVAAVRKLFRLGPAPAEPPGTFQAIAKI